MNIQLSANDSEILQSLFNNALRNCLVTFRNQENTGNKCMS